MGYEFKFKESEERMKLLYTLGALLLLSTSAMAQELNPVMPVEPAPEVEQAPTPEVTPWKQINRVITCNSLGFIRNILETNGQTIYATGYKTPEYLPMDPFDGIIITRNEVTLEYTVLLIKSDLNIACVLAGGQRFELVE
jgi:hypothetical protein